MKRKFGLILSVLGLALFSSNSFATEENITMEKFLSNDNFELSKESFDLNSDETALLVNTTEKM